MTNEPSRRPEDEDTTPSESAETASTGADVWATIEDQIADILRDEDEDDPTDPAHRDFDLSVASPYRHVEPQPKFWFTRRWILVVVAFAAISGMLLPYLIDIF